MSSSNVETVTQTADKIKVGLAIAVFLGGLLAFYLLNQQPIAIRLLAILLGAVAALVIAWFSEPGQRFIGFSRESVQEARKVVWPTRDETLKMTGIVFLFVVIMAIFLWLTDKSIEFLLYDLLLGWR